MAHASRGEDISVRLRDTVAELKAEMADVLRSLLRIPSVSGDERALVEFVADYARGRGLDTDVWQSTEAELERYVRPVPPHKPLAGRPTAVLKLAGTGSGRSLVFNAHSDVVAAPSDPAWICDPWSGTLVDGVMYGRGACDVKGPMVSALWAMLAIKQSGVVLAGDVLLEVVPGEEDCVGLGTLGSICRGYRADAAVVLEPTEGMPRCASRSGCRFAVTTRGRAVHGTVKWLGVDAIESMRIVQSVLPELEQRWNDRNADELFAGYPIARPMTVDTIHGGRWQGMVCDLCTLAGYLELLPRDDVQKMMVRFESELLDFYAKAGGDPAMLSVAFSEVYFGHRTREDSGLCEHARAVMAATDALVGSHRTVKGWAGFNAGCEAGVRASVHQTPTLVWGPGDLADAHSANERVRLRDVETAAVDFALIAKDWCTKAEHT